MNPLKITIDPITRLEGHGKIDIFLDESGNVKKTYFQVPELRGFEKFVEGRPAEEMPQITSRICGVCPTAHHLASTKALDDLYKVEPTLTARKIRELVNSTFFVEDHALHFFFLGGPDFIVGVDAPKGLRNIIGVLNKVGIEVGSEVIKIRKLLRELIALAGGKTIHPVFGLPGGVSKQITREMQEKFINGAENAVKFALFCLELFKKVAIREGGYIDLMMSDEYTHKTYYMGTVDDENRMNFYDGWIRVITPEGKEFAKFKARDYLSHIAEHVEPWTYVKFCYLKNVGWKGFVDGNENGIYSVGPLARLNVADRMATPLAQEAYDEFYDKLGGKPVHYTLANHWARLIEMLYAAERMLELAKDPDIVRDDIRIIPNAVPSEGIGQVEAPRGTLIHHYQTDERGLIKSANLIVATQNNSARIVLSVDKVARNKIKGGQVDDGILNMIEMAFRAYDPCHACATHSLQSGIPLMIRVYNCDGVLVREIISE